MTLNIAPLLTRLKLRYNRFPTSAGIYLTGKTAAHGFAQARGNSIKTSIFADNQDLLQLLSEPYRPHIVCVATDVSAGENYPCPVMLQLLHNEGYSVITTKIELLISSFGLAQEEEKLEEWFAQNGLDMRPAPEPVTIRAALTSLVGYFYLNDEFELFPREQSILPLLFEEHPLFKTLRQIPYGEVTTFSELAKSLGLHWTEERIMAEISRLPGQADVPGHRVVGREGKLSELFPGGRDLQKEKLTWEMVPFQPGDRVDLKKALWTRLKYRPLTNYIKHANLTEKFIEMHFDEIESIISNELPRAARRLGSWWQDEKPHAQIWQDAGCRIAGVNIQMETVAFVRKTER
jgi:alkylated DNA nucleotide flippase Atl1